MPAPQIFISYRRDDAAGYARAVGDELARHFGAERVFIDVDDIGAGLAFDDAIRQAVGASRVLLVMMGKRWQGERAGAVPRIFDAGDFVRLEVAAALAAGLRVIPLLIDGAAMPTEAQLPDDLRPLARRNALEIDNTRFAADIERLVAALRDALGEPAPRLASAAAPTHSSPRSTSARAGPKVALWLLLAAVVVAVAVAIAMASAKLWQPRSASRDASPAAAGPGDLVAASAAPGLARADVNGAWQAEVNYDWPNARYLERFSFAGEAAELHGSASFLGVARGVLEGRTDAAGLRFVTRSGEIGAGAATDTVHRYRGRRVGDELHFVMQTEGGSSAHAPVEFVARRSPAASTSAKPASGSSASAPS